MQPKIFSKSIFEDSRGFFIENFKKADFSEQFVQDNLRKCILVNYAPKKWTAC